MSNIFFYFFFHFIHKKYTFVFISISIFIHYYYFIIIITFIICTYSWWRFVFIFYCYYSSRAIVNKYIYYCVCWMLASLQKQLNLWVIQHFCVSLYSYFIHVWSRIEKIKKKKIWIDHFRLYIIYIYIHHRIVLCVIWFNLILVSLLCSSLLPLCVHEWKVNSYNDVDALCPQAYCHENSYYRFNYITSCKDKFSFSPQTINIKLFVYVFYSTVNFNSPLTSLFWWNAHIIINVFIYTIYVFQ